MLAHQHMVLGGQDLDLSSNEMAKDEDELKLVGRKDSQIMKVQRPADEKNAMKNGNGVTQVASDIGTTGIMLMRSMYRACGKMMKSVKIVRKRRLKRIGMKESMSIYSNVNLRKLANITIKDFGKGPVSLERLR